MHLEQRDAHLAESSELAGFRTARLDVVSGFAQVLGAMADESPFDRAQGRRLLSQGLDELEASSLGDGSAERDALRESVGAARAALDALDEPGSGAVRLVSLRVAVGRLETLAGGIDADAELALARADDAQDALFEATLVASALLLGLAFALLWRALLGAEAASAARDEAESGRMSPSASVSRRTCASRRRWRRSGGSPAASRTTSTTSSPSSTRTPSCCSTSRPRTSRSIARRWERSARPVVAPRRSRSSSSPSAARR
jgi:hypothetical protein